MSYEQLSLSGFIKEMKDVSTGPHPRKFCFVLGAGASRSSGIKSGQELVAIWDEELSERNPEAHQAWKEKLGVTVENRSSFYSQFYEKRFSRCPRDGYNYLEKLMEHAKPSAGYVMLSYLLTKPSHNVVITTNFDHLIEDAVNYYAQTIPMVIGHEALTHYITSPITRPTIVKIHRDLLFDPKNKVSEVDSLHENWKGALDVIFTHYHPVFIGYAGNDNSLMDFLLANVDKFASDQWSCPYWMLYKTDEPNDKIRTLLEKSNGYCIRHDGFDETLYLIGAALGYTMPTEEEFLSDAKKRYQTLSSSIDEFTDKLSAPEPSLPKEAPRPALPAEDPNLDQAVVQVTDQSELSRKYRQALQLSIGKNYDEALNIERELVQAAPDNARYYHLLGDTLHKMGNYDEALKEKERAVELDSQNPRYLSSLSSTQQEVGQLEQALASIQKAISLKSDESLYYSELGFILQDMERHEEAVKAYQSAIELSPDDAFYHDLLGGALAKSGRMEEALSALQNAVSLNPTDPFLHYDLGSHLHDMERYEEALSEKQAAVTLDPSDPLYHNGLGETLYALGNYDDALSEKREAVLLKPTDPYYHASLSDTLYDLNRLEEALESEQRAVELDPDNPIFHFDLGNILHSLGRLEEAVVEKEKAVRLAPDDPQYHESLSLTKKALQAKKSKKK